MAITVPYFSMKFKSSLRDNYEFANTGADAGSLKDADLWELNKYGLARHFKMRGWHEIRITWRMGQDAKEVLKSYGFHN